MKHRKSISCSALLLGCSLQSLSADALDLSNALEWGSAEEVAVASPFKRWNKSPLLGLPGSPVEKLGKVDVNAINQSPTPSTGDDFSAITTETSSDDLGGLLDNAEPASSNDDNGMDFGDLLGEDSSSSKSDTSSDDSGFGDLLGDLDLDSSSDEKPSTTDTSADDMDFGDLLGDLDTKPEAEPAAKATPVAKTAASSDAKTPAETQPEASELKAPEALSKKSKATPEPVAEQRVLDSDTPFTFKLGNVTVTWRRGYHPGEAKVSTNGTFKLLHFLEAIDQPGLLEVNKSEAIRERLNDDIQLKFSNSSLSDVLKWLSDAYQVPFTFKNRILEI